MKKKIISFTMLIALLSLQRAIYAQPSISGTIQHQGLTRTYIMNVPDSYSDTIAYPIVFCFHGYEESSAWMQMYSRFGYMASENNFIAVFPQGTLDNNGNAYWNTFGTTYGSFVDDIGFTSKLLAEISEDYNIDPRRVYSMGNSNGGYMSYVLACQLSETFAAVASVNGSMLPDTISARNPRHPMPILEIHGDNDQSVPYDGEPYSESITDVLKYWSNYNNCNDTPVVTEMPDIDSTDGSTVEYIVYEGGDNEANVEHFKILGGGHDWPGRPSANQDIDASEVIWQFFSKHQLPPIKVESIEFRKDTIQLDIGDLYMLKPSIIPETATDKSISWSSENDDVASVSEIGIVTAKGDGSTNIIINSNDGNAISTVTVVVYSNSTVQPEISLNSIRVYPNPTTGIINIDAFEDVSSITVYSSVGEVILVTNDMIVDLSAYPSGVYYVNITMQNGISINRKVMLAK